MSTRNVSFVTMRELEQGEEIFIMLYVTGKILGIVRQYRHSFAMLALSQALDTSCRFPAQNKTPC